jgi:DNA invertase Pin-like site-specific DNA recombinase
LVFHIFGALAKFEHDLIPERTITGLQPARAPGRKGCQKPAIEDADLKKACSHAVRPEHHEKKAAEYFAVSRTTLNASVQRLAQPMELS